MQFAKLQELFEISEVIFLYRVFIVEDDAKIAGQMASLINSWGMDSRIASDFRDVLSEFGEYSPHIVLLDITLPFFGGYHWCQEIRKLSKLPIMFISSASDNMNVVMAMNMGADDFIAKPFDGNVLIAKIQALLRRAYDFTPELQVISHRGLILDTSDGTAVYGSEKIALTKNEYRILLLLMRNRTKTVSREKLMEYLWQTDDFIDENTLTVNVNRLRKKLAAAGLSDFITTKFGVGYIIA